MKNKKLEGFSKLKFTSKEILMKHMVIVLVGIWSNNHIRFSICLRLIVKPSTSLRLPFKLKLIWGQELQGIRRRWHTFLKVQVGLSLLTPWTNNFATTNHSKWKSPITLNYNKSLNTKKPFANLHLISPSLAVTQNRKPSPTRNHQSASNGPMNNFNDRPTTSRKLSNNEAGLAAPNGAPAAAWEGFTWTGAE